MRLEPESPALLRLAQDHRRFGRHDLSLVVDGAESETARGERMIRPIPV
jgi:hypothetical protein